MTKNNKAKLQRLSLTNEFSDPIDPKRTQISDEFFKHYEYYLTHALNHTKGDEEEADELLLRTFITAYKEKEHFSENCILSDWIEAIMLDENEERLARIEDEQDIADALLSETDEISSEELEYIEGLRRELHKIVQHLEPDQIEEIENLMKQESTSLSQSLIDVLSRSKDLKEAYARRYLRDEKPSFH